MNFNPSTQPGVEIPSDTLVVPVFSLTLIIQEPTDHNPQLLARRPLKVAVLGATGAVGQELLALLSERQFPVGELIALASARSAAASICSTCNRSQVLHG